MKTLNELLNDLESQTIIIKEELQKNYNLSVENWELQPLHDTRQSFYKKAYVYKVIARRHTTQSQVIFSLLYSYNTLVCINIEVTPENGINLSYYNLNYNINETLLFSNTTLRHIKEFLYQNSCAVDMQHITTLTKKDIIKNNDKVYQY